MLEKDIEQRVCKHAQKFGVLTRKYTSPSHRSVPDRLFIFPGALVVFIEFKAPGKLPTKGQVREMKKLVERDHYVYVVDDVEKGKALVDTLVAIAGRPNPTSLAQAAKMVAKSKLGIRL